MRFALAILLLGAGCRQIFGLDEPEPVTPVDDAAVDAADSGDPDGWRSGTRLKLMWNDYNGTRDYTGLYDSVLGTRCNANVWSDGKRYCTPALLGAVFAPFDGIAYLDNNCTQMIGIRSKLDAACSAMYGNFHMQIERRPCGEGSRRVKLFDRQQQLPNTTMFHTKDSNGNCSQGQVSTSYDLFELGAEIPVSELVEMTIESESSNGRLARQVFAGADGSRVPAGAYDAQLETGCTLQEPGTCVPPVSSVGTYANATCSQPLGEAATGCAQPRFAARARRPGCPDPMLEYYATSAKVTPTFIYSFLGTNCTAGGPVGTTDYYSTTTPITPASLARMIEPASGQQITRVYYEDANVRLRSGVLYDHANAVVCGTSGTRCLPSGSGVNTIFTDSNCMVTKDVALVARGHDSCGLPVKPKFATKSSYSASECKTTFEVYTVEDLYAGPVYTGMPGNCSQNTDTYFVRYNLGPRVPDEDFAVATPMIDP